MPEIGRFTGRHVLAELHGVDPGLLNDAVRLGELLRVAVTEAGATVVDVVAKRFVPQGATVIALLASSESPGDLIGLAALVFGKWRPFGTGSGPSPPLTSRREKSFIRRAFS